MKRFLLALALLVPMLPAAAQPAQPPQAQGVLARHLVMFTRAGPNFANARDHIAEARAHQALYERLAAEGHTIAGGAFEGAPVLGMTVWREGIDEARARELIREDALPGLGCMGCRWGWPPI